MESLDQQEIKREIREKKLTMMDMPRFIEEKVDDAYQEGLEDEVSIEEEKLKFAIGVLEEMKLREMFLDEKLLELQSELCRYMK